MTVVATVAADGHAGRARAPTTKAAEGSGEKSGDRPKRSRNRNRRRTRGGKPAAAGES